MLKVTPAEVFSSMVAVRGEGPYDFKQDVILLGSDLEVTSVQSAEKLANEIDFMDPMRLDWRVSPDGGATRLGGAQSENRLYVTLAAPLGNRLESFLHVSCKAAKGEATEALPDEIDFHDPAVLEWQVSPDGEIWLGGAQSRNRTYVTRDVPNTGSRFYTLLHNSCRDADGLADEAQVIAAIWDDFTDLAVYRVDPTGKTEGTQLTYYAQWNCMNTETSELLQSGDGQCGAWAKFLIDEVGAQGITAAYPWITFKSKDIFAIENGFLVVRWNLTTGSGVSEDPTGLYPYLNLPKNPLIVNNAYDFLFKQVTDDTSEVAGQGPQNLNPASLFNNHQVARLPYRDAQGQIKLSYYDPSYGLFYEEFDDIDPGAISAHFKWYSNWKVDEDDVNLDLDGNGIIGEQNVEVSAIIIQKNASGDDLVSFPRSYP